MSSGRFGVRALGNKLLELVDGVGVPAKEPRAVADLRYKPKTIRSKVTHRLPKHFPQLSQLQAKGFSLVCVLSCLWTCSTRLIGGPGGKPMSEAVWGRSASSPEPLVAELARQGLGFRLLDITVSIQIAGRTGPLRGLNRKHLRVQASDLGEIGVAGSQMTGHAVKRVGGLVRRTVETSASLHRAEKRAGR